MLLHTFDKDCNMSLSQFSLQVYRKTWRAGLNRFPQILFSRGRTRDEYHFSGMKQLVMKLVATNGEIAFQKEQK